MCKECGKNNRCSKCSDSSSSSSASTDVFLAQLQDQIQDLLAATRFLNGHPELVVEDADDISSFDFSTGEGLDNWLGWAICDGQDHYSARYKKIIHTPNYTDRFIVMAGGTYNVGNTGGENTHVLVTGELPAHTHTVTDPGHDHEITDPQHNHGATSGPHTHTFTGTAHNHSLDPAGAHTHTKVFKVEVNADIDTTGGSQSYLVNDTGTADSSETMSVDGVGDHTHTVGNATAGGTIGNTTVGVTISNSSTGITVNSNTTGITNQNTGSDHAHENRPPYFAAFWVKYIG